MNPYDVLMLKPGRFSLHELDANYRKLMAQLQSSKQRLPSHSANDVAKMLTRAYDAVYAEFCADAGNNRRATTTSPSPQVSSFPVHNHNSATVRRASGRTSSTSIGSSGVSDGMDDDKRREIAKKFDMSKFNRLFESHRQADVYDKGYEDWLRSNADCDDAPKTCDEYDEFYDPEPVTYMRGKGMGFTELGISDVNDFGNLTEYGPKGGVKFADLRNAHSARNNLINSRLEAEFRERPRTVEDVMAERANKAMLEMRPQERRKVEERRLVAQRADRERERLRRAALEKAARHYDRVHGLMFTPQA